MQSNPRDLAYARHIGRVGALAVTLGVGMAVTLGQGTAWATGEPGGGDTGNVAGPASPPADDPGANLPTRHAHTGIATTDVLFHRPGGAFTFAGPISKITTPTHSSVPTNPRTRRAEGSTTSSPTPPGLRSFAQNFSSPRDFARLAPRTRNTIVGAPPVTAQRVVVDETDQPAPQPTAGPTAAQIAALANVPKTFIATVAGVATALLSPFGHNAPSAPPNTPVLWAVLAVVRREFFNQTPEITSTVYEPDSSGNIKISLNQTDADGDTLKYAATGGAKGTVVLNPDGHSYTYTPNPGQTGTDTITVTANDDTSPHIHGLPGLLNALSLGRLGEPGDTATAIVTVKLNTPPTLTVTPDEPDGTGKVTVTVVATDADGNPLSLSATQPAGASGTVGQVTLVDAAKGTYTVDYTPSDDAGFAAAATDGVDTDTFDVTVDDGHGGKVTKTVTVTIAPGDITSNPEAAFNATESVVSSQIDAVNAAQAAMAATIKSIDPTIEAADLTGVVLKAQTIIIIGLAQQGISIDDPNPGPTPQLGADAKTELENTLGPLSQTQVDQLTSETMTARSAKDKLSQPLTVSAEAGALATWNAAGDGKPVFERVEYTVAPDGSVTGQVFFVDPDNDPAHPLVYEVVEEVGYFDPNATTPGSLIVAAPNPGNPADLPVVTFHVKVTDSDGNVVTQAITVDRTPPLPTSLSNPSSGYTWSQIGAGLGDISSAAATLDTAATQAEAARKQALVDRLQAPDSEQVAAATQSELAAVQALIAAYANQAAVFGGAAAIGAASQV